MTTPSSGVIAPTESQGPSTGVAAVAAGSAPSFDSYEVAYAYANEMMRKDAPLSGVARGLSVGEWGTVRDRIADAHVAGQKAALPNNKVRDARAESGASPSVEAPTE